MVRHEQKRYLINGAELQHTRYALTATPYSNWVERVFFFESQIAAAAVPAHPRSFRGIAFRRIP